MATRRGGVKRVNLSQFASVRPSGITALKLKEGDELVSARLARDEDEVILTTEMGRALRFALSSVRLTPRGSGCVRGILLSPGDQIVSLDITAPDSSLLTITANGFGKRTLLPRYRAQRRGGRGIKAHHLSKKSGKLVAAAVVQPSQELMLISREGLVIRMPVEGISHQGRASRGVGLMRLSPDDAVASIACLGNKG
jgi:DNA gyrase subunit A